ncbi:UNVERIFIED_CONTAM: RagB/SusD family nutrient uptake outer membrane protein, partial [Prevotella sp. 15_C9]
GRIYCKKFVIAPVLPNQSDANFIVLRYADVLLMYAEALNENGYKADGDALNYLNDIRKRAGLEVYTAGELSSQELFREVVWKERRF